jgi:glutaredoxin-like protein
MAENEALEIYWRPGCPYCDRLLRVLITEGVEFQLHNIWEDDGAREFVRSHNNGNETVPTVVYGDQILVNPKPKELMEELQHTE